MTGTDAVPARPVSTFAGVVTSLHPGPYGGGVAVARDEVDRLRRAVVPRGVLPRAPEAGERWRFTGEAR